MKKTPPVDKISKNYSKLKQIGSMAKTLYFFSIISLLFSCNKRPEPVFTDKIDEVNNHIILLTNYEKQYRNEKDTVLLDLVLGSKNTDVRNSIQKLIKKGLIQKENSNLKLVLEFLPVLDFYTETSNNILESIIISNNSISDEANDDLTYSIEKNYGSSDIYYFVQSDYGAYQKIYWIKGDLLIKKEATFNYREDSMGNQNLDFNGISVNITYTKLSINENKEKIEKIENDKIENEETNKRILQRDKKDSVANYF